MPIAQLKGQRVLVVGLGRSGLSAARFLSRQGARVTVVDQSPRTALTHSKKLPSSAVLRSGVRRFDVRRFRLIVVSPGVPWNHPQLVRARRRGIPVLPEFELGWLVRRPCRTVVITGTNGKTTTTALIGHLLRSARKKTLVAGNIGTPLTEVASEITARTFLVLELSSYQIEGLREFKPDVGVWLNLTPDHLGRHRTMASYAKIKARLFSNCTRANVAILNRRDRWIVKMAKRIPAKKIWFTTPAFRSLASAGRLRGKHNLENMAAAAAACRSMGLSPAAIRRGLRSFKGVPHRIEPVRSIRGVRYYNDSKSTNVHSTAVALAALPKGIHLIMGGRHKGTSYRMLEKMIKRKVRRIYAVGEAARLVRRELGRNADVVLTSTVRRAVRAAARSARPGESVLLSPACASFDQYRNFEERGRDFARCVRAIRP